MNNIRFRFMEEALQLLQYAADPNIVSLELKGVADPIRRIFSALYQKLIDHGVELPEEMRNLCATNVSDKIDFRIFYSDLLRIVFKRLILTVQREGTELSANAISNVLKVFEILIAVSILPSLEDGVAVPMEKRVTFVKMWKNFEDDNFSRTELKKTIEIFFELAEINQGLKSQLISKFLSDFISANEQVGVFTF